MVTLVRSDTLSVSEEYQEKKGNSWLKQGALIRACVGDTWLEQVDEKAFLAQGPRRLVSGQ